MKNVELVTLLTLTVDLLCPLVSTAFTVVFLTGATVIESILHFNQLFALVAFGLVIELLVIGWELK